MPFHAAFRGARSLILRAPTHTIPYRAMFDLPSLTTHVTRCEAKLKNVRSLDASGNGAKRMDPGNAPSQHAVSRRSPSSKQRTVPPAGCSYSRGFGCGFTAHQVPQPQKRGILRSAPRHRIYCVIPDNRWNAWIRPVAQAA